MKKYTVYKILNSINNKEYIGVHKTDNPYDSYMGSGPLILNAIKKYGKDNFKKEILAIFDTAKEAYELEKELVNKEFISSSNNYNITEGGHGGWYHIKNNGSYMKNPINAKRISLLAQNTRSKNKPYYDKISIKNFRIASINNIGKKHSAATLEKRSNSLNEFYKNNVSVLKGIPLNEEHKIALSNGWTDEKKKKKSDYMKEKIKNNPDIVKTNLGKKFTNSTKSKMSNSAKERCKALNSIDIQCPYCNKVGKPSGMKRWHFENCKEK